MGDTMKLAVRLMLCALAAALMLAIVNALTAGRIAENNREKMNAARSEVIGDYEFADAGADIADAEYITGVYLALDGDACAGYVYELESRGYGGAIYLCVGVSAEGEVVGVSVSAHSETKGLGADAGARFLGSFAGLPGKADAAEDVETMTGATISSDAVKRAVDEALSHYEANFSAGEAGL